MALMQDASSQRPADGRTALRVVFATLEEFRREFATNLTRGGLFVPSTADVEMREEVTVELVLDFCSASFELPAEVVSVVPRELAQAGGTPGIAVQILVEARALRERFTAIVGQLSEPDPGKVVGERRRADRRPARVVARLNSGDEIYGVRTRDVSRSGALVTLEGSVVPLGECVELSLVHPGSSEELRVRGTVVRHVESEGGVTAAAIQFEAEETARPEVVKFIDDLMSVEHARRLAGINGSLDELGLANLLQSFSVCTPHGTLSVTRGPEEGRVVFDNNELLSARLGPASGIKALSRMLAWKEGSFEFHARVDDADREEAVMPLAAAILEAAAQLDEASRVEALPIANTEHLAVDDARLKSERANLDRTEGAVVDLAAAGFTVRGILDVVPENDAVILAVVNSLLARGVLRPG